MTFIPSHLGAADASHEKILLVDDNPINLQVLMETLRVRKSRLFVAKDGQAALDTARKTKLDLILLDIMMPGMDGFEVCRRLKDSPATSGIPIIFLSAMDRTEDKVNGLSLGAVDYITKPFQPEEVLVRVETHLTLHRLQREVQNQRDQLEHELQTVSQLQRKLLPKTLPTSANLDLATFYATSRYAGGDYYDFHEFPDGRLGILVADAEGHSSPAAVLMAMTCTLFKAFGGDFGDPEALLVYLNRYLCALAEPSFVTALYAVYDPQERRLKAGRAGHNYPMLYDAATGKAHEWSLAGVMPLAVAFFETVPVEEIQLSPEDRFLLYTDGITERFNKSGLAYGESRLLSSLEQTANMDVSGAIDEIMRQVDAFASPLAADDDQALVLGVVN